MVQNSQPLSDVRETVVVTFRFPAVAPYVVPKCEKMR
jgi:hypothetical protein